MSHQSSFFLSNKMHHRSLGRSFGYGQPHWTCFKPFYLISVQVTLKRTRCCCEISCSVILCALQCYSETVHFTIKNWLVCGPHLACKLSWQWVTLILNAADTIHRALHRVCMQEIYLMLKFSASHCKTEFAIKPRYVVPHS
jgi:hypothetical protein